MAEGAAEAGVPPSGTEGIATGVEVAEILPPEHHGPSIASRLDHIGHMTSLGHNEPPSSGSDPIHGCERASGRNRGPASAPMKRAVSSRGDQRASMSSRSRPGRGSLRQALPDPGQIRQVFAGGNHVGGFSRMAAQGPRYVAASPDPEPVRAFEFEHGRDVVESVRDLTVPRRRATGGSLLRHGFHRRYSPTRSASAMARRRAARSTSRQLGSRESFSRSTGSANRRKR